MNPDLLTELVRAGNDGVIPAPLTGEDMGAYKFRAACAGAIVATAWLAKKATEQQMVEQEAKGRAREEISGAAMGGGRPDDVPGTSSVTTSVTAPDGTALHPQRTTEEIDRILRRPHLNGSGRRQDAQDLAEIGVD